MLRELVIYVMADRDMDQQQLVESSGLAAGTVRNFLRGYTSSEPSVATLNKLGSALKVAPEYLLMAYNKPGTSKEQVELFEQYRQSIKDLHTVSLDEKGLAKLKELTEEIGAIADEVYASPEIQTIEQRVEEFARKYNLVSQPSDDKDM